jgi:hypothetical protein
MPGAHADVYVSSEITEFVLHINLYAIWARCREHDLLRAREENKKSPSGNQCPRAPFNYTHSTHP